MREGSEAPTAPLEADHRRLDGILAELKRALASGDRAVARERFVDSRDGLERHITAEEEILFPAFEEPSDEMGSGRTAVMRMEHAELQKQTAEIDGLPEEGRMEELYPALARLTAQILSHNGKEERVLYPKTDRRARNPRRLEGALRDFLGDGDWGDEGPSDHCP